jgi:hypothetical protein
MWAAVQSAVSAANGHASAQPCNTPRAAQIGSANRRGHKGRGVKKMDVVKVCILAGWG